MPVPSYAVGVARDSTNGRKQGSKGSSVLRAWLRRLRNTLSTSRRLVRQRGESWGFHRFYGLTACPLGGRTLLDYPWTTRPKLDAYARKTKPFSCGTVPLWAPPWLLGEWGKVGKLRERFYPCRASRTRPLYTGTGYPAEFEWEPSTTSRDFGNGSGRLSKTSTDAPDDYSKPLRRLPRRLLFHFPEWLHNACYGNRVPIC